MSDTTTLLTQLAAPVARIDARVASLPLDPIIITKHYRITTIEMVVVRVTDADGAHGTSTMWCFGQRQAAVLVSMMRVLAECVRRTGGIDATTILGDLHREINFFGFKGVSVFAYSAVDMALVDLACRRHDRSLSSILGRRRDEIPAYWSGLYSNQTLDGIIAEVDEKLDAGFRAMKLRLGGRPLDDDLVRVDAVLDRLTDGCSLMVDAVQSWSRDEALAAVDHLADRPIVWVEDPLVHLDYDGLRAVVERSRLPIASGENEYLRQGFDQLLSTGLPVLLVDLERVGGILEWLAVADRAARLGVTMTPHVYPHIALHLCSALDQEHNWIEYMPWWDSLHGGTIEMRDGAFVVPDRAGTGFDLDPDRLERHAVGGWSEL